MQIKIARNTLTRKGLSSLTLAALVVIGVSGCATTPAVTDQSSQLLQISRQWQDHLANERFGRALALVSDEFSSRAWPDKASLAEYFALAKDRGFFSNATIQHGEVSISVSSADARVYPVGIRADLGLALFALSLQREQSAWKITSLEMELY